MDSASMRWLGRGGFRRLPGRGRGTDGELILVEVGVGHAGPAGFNLAGVERIWELPGNLNLKKRYARL